MRMGEKSMKMGGTQKKGSKPGTQKPTHPKVSERDDQPTLTMPLQLQIAEHSYGQPRQPCHNYFDISWKKSTVRYTSFLDHADACTIQKHMFVSSRTIADNSKSTRPHWSSRVATLCRVFPPRCPNHMASSIKCTHDESWRWDTW